MAIRKGSTVTWKWGGSTASGSVVPADVIEQEDGTTVLKLSSEVDHA